MLRRFFVADYAGPQRTTHQLELVNTLICLVSETCTGNSCLVAAIAAPQPPSLDPAATQLQQLITQARVLTQRLHVKYVAAAREAVVQSVKRLTHPRPAAVGPWVLQALFATEAPAAAVAAAASHADEPNAAVQAQTRAATDVVRRYQQQKQRMQEQPPQLPQPQPQQAQQQPQRKRAIATVMLE